MTSPSPANTAAAPANRLLGIGCMCVAVAIFSLQDTSGKASIVLFGLPVLQVLAMRFIVHVVLNTLYLGPHRVPMLLRSKRPYLQLGRGVIMSLSTLFTLIALNFLRLDQTMAINFLTPLIVALIAGPLLGEWVGWRRMVAIGVGFLGVLLVIRPDIGGVHWAMGLALAAAFSYAIYIIATRYITPYDSAEITQFYTPLGGLIVFGPMVFVSWTTPQTWQAWLALIATGFFGTISHWFLIQAQRRAPASIVTPFIYTQIVWSVTLGVLVFGDWPDAYTLAGASIVIGSGLYLLYREAVRARENRSARLSQP